MDVDENPFAQAETGRTQFNVVYGFRPRTDQLKSASQNCTPRYKDVKSGSFAYADQPVLTERNGQRNLEAYTDANVMKVKYEACRKARRQLEDQVREKTKHLAVAESRARELEHETTSLTKTVHQQAEIITNLQSEHHTEESETLARWKTVIRQQETRIAELELENCRLRESMEVDAQKMKTMRNSYNLILGISPAKQ